LGEELWRDLVDMVGPYRSLRDVVVEGPARRADEDGGDEIAEFDEVDGRPYESLDLSEGLCEDLEIPDWPDGWDEETIWGDISPEKRRSLQRLLGSQTPKWMDT
jgi:hypothetical protein